VEPILTPAEMAEADRRTIAAGTPVEVLMDRAGRSVAWAVRRQLDGVYGCRAVVVCGKGNNGGGGPLAAPGLPRPGGRRRRPAAGIGGDTGATTAGGPTPGDAGRGLAAGEGAAGASEGRAAVLGGGGSGGRRGGARCGGEAATPARPGGVWCAVPGQDAAEQAG